MKSSLKPLCLLLFLNSCASEEFKKSEETKEIEKKVFNLSKIENTFPSANSHENFKIILEHLKFESRNFNPSVTAKFTTNENVKLFLYNNTNLSNKLFSLFNNIIFPNSEEIKSIPLADDRLLKFAKASDEKYKYTLWSKYFAEFAGIHIFDTIQEFRLRFEILKSFAEINGLLANDANDFAKALLLSNNISLEFPVNSQLLYNVENQISNEQIKDYWQYFATFNLSKSVYEIGAKIQVPGEKSIYLDKSYNIVETKKSVNPNFVCLTESPDCPTKGLAAHDVNYFFNIDTIINGEKITKYDNQQVNTFRLSGGEIKEINFLNGIKLVRLPLKKDLEWENHRTPLPQKITKIHQFVEESKISLLSLLNNVSEQELKDLSPTKLTPSIKADFLKFLQNINQQSVDAILKSNWSSQEYTYDEANNRLNLNSAFYAKFENLVTPLENTATKALVTQKLASIFFEHYFQNSDFTVLQEKKIKFFDLIFSQKQQKAKMIKLSENQLDIEAQRNTYKNQSIQHIKNLEEKLRAFMSRYGEVATISHKSISNDKICIIFYIRTSCYLGFTYYNEKNNLQFEINFKDNRIWKVDAIELITYHLNAIGQTYNSSEMNLSLDFQQSYSENHRSIDIETGKGQKITIKDLDSSDDLILKSLFESLDIGVEKNF